MHLRIFVTLLAAAIPALTSAQTTTVYVVRHAERASNDADSPLSDLGIARAATLAAALASANIDAALVTPRIRTQQTAAPLVAARSLSVDTVSFGANGAAHIQAITALVRGKHLGHNVLIVGHSNTVPAIVTALGGPALPELCEKAFANIFVVTIAGGRSSVARLSYGAADPADAASCPSTMPR